MVIVSMYGADAYKKWAQDALVDLMRRGMLYANPSLSEKEASELAFKFVACVWDGKQPTGNVGFVGLYFPLKPPESAAELPRGMRRDGAAAISSRRRRPTAETVKKRRPGWLGRDGVA